MYKQYLFLLSVEELAASILGNDEEHSEKSEKSEKSERKRRDKRRLSFKRKSTDDGKNPDK